MREPLLSVVRVAAGAGLLSAVLVGTHVTTSDPTEGSELRVALRTSAGTVRDCRKFTEEELAALPMHMRRPETCESRAVAYRLVLTLDGIELFTRDYTAAGIHGDRPLTVDERFPIVTGEHTVGVRFAPADTAGSAGLPVFALDARVQFIEGRIRVAALDGSTQALTIR